MFSFKFFCVASEQYCFGILATSFHRTRRFSAELSFWWRKAFFFSWTKPPNPTIESVTLARRSYSFSRPSSKHIVDEISGSSPISHSCDEARTMFRNRNCFDLQGEGGHTSRRNAVCFGGNLPFGFSFERCA